MAIERLNAAQGAALLEQLALLLRDAVEGGASVGWVDVPMRDEALAYWRAVLGQVEDGSRLLLVDREGDHVLGSVQLELAGKPNGRHRAELPDGKGAALP